MLRGEGGVGLPVRPRRRRPARRRRRQRRVSRAAPAPTSCAAAPASTSPTSTAPRTAVHDRSRRRHGLRRRLRKATACSASRTSLGTAINDRLTGNAGANRARGLRRRRHPDRAGRRRPVRLQLTGRQLRPRRRTASSISAARRATRSTWPTSTPTSRRPATRRSSSSARRQFTGAGQLRFYQQNGDTVDRGQHRPTRRRRGDADRARPAGLAAGAATSSCSGYIRRRTLVRPPSRSCTRHNVSAPATK